MITHLIRDCVSLASHPISDGSFNQRRFISQLVRGDGGEEGLGVGGNVPHAAAPRIVDIASESARRHGSTAEALALWWRGGRQEGCGGRLGSGVEAQICSMLQQQMANAMTQQQ